MEPDNFHLVPVLEKWRSQRRETIKGLLELADSLDKHNRNIKISGVAGSSTSIVGAGVAIGTAVAAPFTGGLSFIPSIAAVSATLGGSAITIGGKIAGSYIKKDVESGTQKLIEEHREQTKEMQNVEEIFLSVELSLVKLMRTMITGVIAENIDVADEERSVDLLAEEDSLLNDTKDITAVDFIQRAQKLSWSFNQSRAIKMFNLGKNIFDAGKGFASGGGATASGGLFRAGPVAATKLPSLCKLVKVGGVAVSIALLPIDIYELVRNSDDLHKGATHAVSEDIRMIVGKLDEEFKLVERHMNTVIRRYSAFARFLIYILRQNCSCSLRETVKDIYENILPLKDVMPTVFEDFDSFEKESEGCKDSLINTIGVMAVEIGDVQNDLLQEISLWLWCAFVTEMGNIVLLQNTHFTDDPLLWSFFGCSFNAFGCDTDKGVSIIIHGTFTGSIDSVHTYKDSNQMDSNWNGRCLVMNIEVASRKFSVVNLFLPINDTNDRFLFCTEALSFIRENANGDIIMACNLAQEMESMTVKLSEDLHLAVDQYGFLRDLFPCKETIHFFRSKPTSTDEYESQVKSILDIVGHYRLPDICAEEIMEADGQILKKANQIYVVKRLSLVHVRTNEVEDRTEFFKVEKKENILELTNTCHMHVEREAVELVDHCEVDHLVRFFGFTSSSAICLALKVNRELKILSPLS